MSRSEKNWLKRAKRVTEQDSDHTRKEIGDLLFAASNFAHKGEVDPETVLREANAKFNQRFCSVENQLTAYFIAGAYSLICSSPVNRRRNRPASGMDRRASTSR